MNKQLADTVFYVTGKGELQTAEQAALEQLIHDHPYFAPAQLLLVAKLKKENSIHIKDQTQKASLFFNNSRWFQYQLSEIKLDSSNFEYKGIEAATQPIFKPTILEEIPVNSDTILTEESIKPLEVQIIDSPTTELIEEKELSYSEIFLPNFSIPTVEHVKAMYNNIDKTVEVVEENPEIKIVETTPEIVSVNEEKNEEQNLEKEEVNQKIAPSLDLTSMKANWDKPLDDEAKLPFEAEPYYTIDYFASQGIQFDFNKEPHDKLTTKMLKFTDWLKKMKGIKPENMEFEEDEELNKTIQNIAVNSNESKEIVTETMAEVFAKQGKTDKAIQLYIKLSFLIPNKSSYFASKIQELKGI